MGFISVREASQKWGISERQIQKLCKECRIECALRLSRIWMFRKMRKSLCFTTYVLM